MKIIYFSAQVQWNFCAFMISQKHSPQNFGKMNYITVYQGGVYYNSNAR